MRNVLLGLLALVASVPSVVQAQTISRMSNRPFSDIADLATQFADNCSKHQALKATCQEYLDGWKRADPDAKLSSIGDLYDYVRSLKQVSCQSGSATFLGIRNTSLVEVKRNFREGEQCAMNPATGRIVASLYCGNVTLGVYAKSLPDSNEVLVTSTPKVENHYNVYLKSLVTVNLNVPVADYSKEAEQTSDTTVKHGHTVRNILIGAGIATAVGVVACVIWCRQEVTVHLTDGGSGGPVNPPNSRIHGTGVPILRFSIGHW